MKSLKIKMNSHKLKYIKYPLILSLGIIASLFFLSVSKLHSFGKNKVIVKDFDWKIYSTEHFDIYYYDEGKNILPLLEHILEQTYDNTASLYDYEPPLKKIPFFIYIGHNDFEQTNITDISEGTGGVTEAFKYRFTVPHLGSKFWLRQVIFHEYCHVNQFNILFNGFWKSARLLKSPIYPLWLMEGLAEYNTGELDATNREMYVRDAALSGNLLPLDHLQNFNHLKPHQVVLAYKESNALMQFIAEEYGEDKLPLILKSFREKFDANIVLLDTIGMTLKDLDIRFREYLEDKYVFMKQDLDLKGPDEDAKPLTEPGTYRNFNTNPVFLPDNKTIVYSTDRKGYTEIVSLDTVTKKIKTLIGGGKFDSVENINTENKTLDISKDGKCMLFTGEKEQKDYIYVYDMKNGMLKTINSGINIINSVCFYTDSKTILFTGMQDGYNNIYSVDITGNNLKQITNTMDDKSDIAVSGDGKFIVFSQEETVNSKTKPYQRNLYTLEMITGKITRITDFEGDETSPCISEDNRTIIFVSDKDGINNLYKLNIETGEINRLTNVTGGNFNPELSPDGQHIVFSSFHKGEKHLYIAAITEFENQITQTGSSPELTQEKTPPASGTFRNYRFNASTDLFFPALYYSTYEGLYLALYWQVSDMLGNHQVSFSTEYMSAYEAMTYRITYSYLKLRPQLLFGFAGSGQHPYMIKEWYELQSQQQVGVLYPLNRYNRFEFIFFTNYEVKDEWTEENLKKELGKWHEHTFTISYIRDTAEGKYLESTSGSRLRLSTEKTTNIFGADRDYTNIKAELHKFYHLGREHALALRLLSRLSYGQDRRSFRIFGYDKVKMDYRERDSLQEMNAVGSDILISNIEWRIPISKDLNYHMWYMFPDFFFKSFYGVVFADAGNVRDEYFTGSSNFYYSYGIGFKFHTFILEMFHFQMNLFYSYSPINGRMGNYFSIGSVF